MRRRLPSPRFGERGSRRWLPFLISGGLLVALLAHLDVDVARALLVRADPRWLTAVVAVQLLDRLLMTWKWWLLINARQRYLTFGAAFKIYYISSFQGFFIPLGVGPDIVRFLKLRRRPIPSETVVASLVIERLLGFVATILMACAAALLLLARIGNRLPDWVIPLLAGTALLVAVVLALLFHPGIRRAARGSRWWLRLERRIPVSEYVRAVRDYRSELALLLRFGLWSMVEQLAFVLTVFFAARALAIPLGFLDCLAFVPISTLLERLPLSVLGLGVREGSFAFFLGLLGIGYSSAIVLALLEFFVFVLTMLPAGLWALWRPDSDSSGNAGASGEP